MKRLQVLGVCGVLLGLTLMTPSHATNVQDSTVATLEAQRAAEFKVVKAEVESFLTHYIKTLESGDEAAIRTLFVADDRLAWFTDGSQSYATPDDILAGMRRYAGITFQTTLSDVRVVPFHASLASARTKFRTHLTIPGAEDFEYGGVITWIVEKHATAGKWRVVEGHTSTPGGPPGKVEDE